jgi:hypothetical protein
MADRLTDDWPKHWTGATQGLCGLISIDGKVFRFMGRPNPEVPAMDQQRLEVTATRTIYNFQADNTTLTVEFLSPLLLDDLELLARPITTIRFEAKSPGANPKIRVYLDLTGELCVDRPHQSVVAGRSQLDSGPVGWIRSEQQPVLARSGDDLRIEWGTAYLVPPTHATLAIGDDRTVRGTFTKSGILPDSDDFRFPRRANDAWPVVAASFEMGTQPETVQIGYDEDYAIEYFGRKLRPYWKRNQQSFGEIAREARKSEQVVRDRCIAFDTQLAREATQRGGEKYAKVVELAYRQSIAAHGIVQDIDGTLLMMSKENFSNGCIATVDVTYPGAPLYLKYNPKLLKAQIEPILAYASSDRWKFPFAPHDLGQYPLANGQVYGGGELSEENQMPVEECGNMLLLVTAHAVASKDHTLVQQYWPLLTQWKDYLVQHGLDPANQLCTDDFAGHLARNANLSVKAILGIAAYGRLCALRGQQDDATQNLSIAKDFAQKWTQLAGGSVPYRLAFDQQGSWSNKYNLVWDELLDLHVFPEGVIQAEIASYASRSNEFGIPLDSRVTYTKGDWIAWTAAMTKTPEAFRTLVDPLYEYLHRSPSRVPFSDWHDTKSAKVIGFQARSVVGGVFMPLLKL